VAAAHSASSSAARVAAFEHLASASGIAVVASRTEGDALAIVAGSSTVA
jgi:hypothetical protein